MSHEQQTPDNLPSSNMVGTKFVKKFREFILSLIEQGNYNESMVVKKAYMEHNVKPKTTRKYLKELEEMEIIGKNKNDVYIMREGE